MSKRKWRWVTRNKDGGMVFVWASALKPRYRNDQPIESGGWWVGDGLCRGLFLEEFNLLFGITVNPGDCLKVEFSQAKVISPKSRTRPAQKGS